MMQTPELCCMEPENYRKYFQALCWSGLRHQEKKKNKGKKEKGKKPKVTTTLATSNAPSLLENPSHFAVYATVRRAVLTRWRLLHQMANECSDESDNEDLSSGSPPPAVSKVTSIGIKTVFTLISQARFTDAEFCEHALQALLDVLQGHTPEELNQESNEIISNLHAMLVEVSSGSGPTGRVEHPTKLTALSSSCLMALAVARGESELILNTVASLVMSHPSLSDQYLQIPNNVTMLQRCVQSVILGTPSRNLWLNYGVPSDSLVSSFPVDLPPLITAGHAELVVRALVSDGCFLYVFTSKGLLKIGSGYGSSIRQHVYLYKPDFFSSDRHGWLGFCRDKLYVRIGRKKTEIYEVDKDTLEVRKMLRLEVGHPPPIEPKSAVFSDGKQLGLIVLTNHDNLTIRMYDVDNDIDSSEGSATQSLRHVSEQSVHLLQRRTLVLGRAPFDEGASRRLTDLDSPAAVQLLDCDDDPLVTISAGLEFGLLTTASGKIYYTGKATSLGYKLSNPNQGRWNLMKETALNKNEASSMKKCKVIQIAVGHEGTHAIVLLDNGTALFTGTARRGEDGDNTKHRRTPKPTRPKKIIKAEGHFIVHAACNYGSTALVTKDGLLLMFGKDAQHCESSGVVTSLKHEVITQVALGKAHAVVLTNHGQVYTFGINNKGQCGREFGYTKEKPLPLRRPHHLPKEEPPSCQPGQHTWLTDYCRVCVVCRECTGFYNACQCADFPNRVPRELCGCGEGEGGCSTCGVCRRCAEAAAPKPPETEEDSERSDSRAAGRSDAEERAAEAEREPAWRAACLPPARVSLPGASRITAIAAGLHHTALLTTYGDVLTFGSNQFGQLGAGDLAAHHKIVRVRVPRASHIAAGSNHTAIITKEGELYTFGSYQKGSLGRPRIEEPRGDRCPVWHATPGRVPRLGPRHSSKAVWVAAAGDQTFVQVSQALINTDTLFSSTVTANANSIVILPNRPEHTFKCITINKADGTCYTFGGPEQVDFVNSLASLDPLYDVLWCYQPQMRVMKCYNILAFDSHKLQRCTASDPDSILFGGDNEFEYPNYGSMKRMEELKMSDYVETVIQADERQIDSAALTNMTILNQELAIPCVLDRQITRMHAALHLLGCLDSLTYAYDNKLCFVECKRESASSPVPPVKEDFLMVNRFESHGGGWGYSGHSVEAVRFMCDTDILLGGFGLFGGRGDYTAKIRLYDIGAEGGDQEGDGELVSESDDVVFECAPRDKFPVLFDNPAPVLAGRWYVAWACINGPSSDCGSSGQAMVINDEIGFHFKTSKKSNNGTDVNAGQIPCLLYNIVTPENPVPARNLEMTEPVLALSKNISRKVTVQCLRSLITLLQWSWNTFKNIVLDSNGQIPINYAKLTTMKHQKRLVYVIRACLRLVRSYINEVYPQNPKKRNTHEYMSYFEAIGDVRNLIQSIMADPTPTCTMLPKKPGKTKTQRVCYVQFALEMTNSILTECHETIISCFHAFFPTPSLKWHHLCYLLYNVKEGVVPPNQIRELTSTCTALCVSRSLRDVLQYVVPMTQSSILLEETRRPDTKKPEPPAKCATVPRASSVKPPPVPPRMGHREAPKPPEPVEVKASYKDWHLLDVLPRLLDIVSIPLQQQLTTRQCGQPHDHGELTQNRRLATACCKLAARGIAELAVGSPENPEDFEASSTVKHLTTPSRFMRVNQTRAWNTGNGSPDAICFTVDRGGVCLVGASVYAGMGHYDYELELLHDVRLRAAVDEGHMSHCWVSVEVAHGTYSSSDCQLDSLQLKFDRPVPLKEDARYAIRLCNHGGRTVNGDCGLPSVKGPDGTTFRFASCSLSFNGTSLARGQIPSLIYYSTSRQSSASDSQSGVASSLRALTVRASWLAAERAGELLRAARSAAGRDAAPLQRSPLVTTLLPHAIATMQDLADTKSVIQLLEIVHTLLPDVAALNQIMPADEPPPTPAPQYCAWAESAHPYSPATISNTRVLFPPSVAWIVVEFDPRSLTAQPEDTLTVYAASGAPRPRCHCADAATKPPPFRKRYVQLCSESSEGEDASERGADDAQCVHYNCNYIAVTQKLSNNGLEWPHKALLVPGNEVIFSLETASDYLNDYNKSNIEELRFGYRCLCTGFEEAPFTTQRNGLAALEMELVYAGAACASRLLAPDLELPSMSHLTVLEVQNAGSPSGEAGESSDSGETSEVDDSEARLLARGLELPSPPSVHQVLDGQPLFRCMSTERQFLSDLVSGAESSAGGRLARWLAPASRVEPTRCELRAPPAPVRPAQRASLPVLLRDQYGDLVTSPALNIEVVVQKIEENPRRPVVATEPPRGPPLPRLSFRPTVRETMRFHSITMMKPFSGFSFEELRLWQRAAGAVGGAAGGNGVGRAPSERLAVRTQPDGAHLATWTPRAPGHYTLRCTLDDHPVPQELTVEVVSCDTECAESAEESPPARGPPLMQLRAARVKRFTAHYSAGLRVRSSPSLQAEELGTVPDGANIVFVEEVSNKDGTWVRLGPESCRLFAEHADVAWCLQYNRHLERCLLRPVTPPQEERENFWGPRDEYADADDSVPPPEPMNECDTEGSPSKRGRAKEEPVPLCPRRLQRKTNGNGGGDEWWTAEKCKEEPTYDYNEMESCSRLAQAGTQTSPEPYDDEAPYFPGSSRDSRIDRTSRPWSGLRSPPAPPPPRKMALSPAQAECLRAVFAALLWHEGIVHDAIACAAFLKFHPQLPKSGATVVTRGSAHHDPRPQRHSVAGAGNGHYLNMEGSTLEELMRSGGESAGGRERAVAAAGPPITEDEPDTSSVSSVVTVLPPALRALVAIWDALCDADEMAAATDKFRKQDSLSDRSDNDGDGRSGGSRASSKKKASTKSPYSVQCELCGVAGAPPPLVSHLRSSHGGCRSATQYGYCRAGVYGPQQSRALCGQSVHATGNLWYAYCERCRERAVRATGHRPSRPAPPPPRAPPAVLPAQPPPPSADLDHRTIRDNAMFLLELASLTDDESSRTSWSSVVEGSRGSPAASSGSSWLPAPPFQCLAALGAAPRFVQPPPHVYRSLGRPTHNNNDTNNRAEGAMSGVSRVPRSVSMDQAGGQSLSSAAGDLRRPPPAHTDTLAGAGSSLLSQPSQALRELSGGGGGVSALRPPRPDAAALVRRPPLAFVLARRDLPRARNKLQTLVRLNTVRQHAFEALNWLLRSTSQPACAHDVMWWFCVAIDKYARLAAANDAERDGSSGVVPTGTAWSGALCPGGRAARGARAALHALLGAVAALAGALPPASPAALQALRCWALRHAPPDRAALHRSQVFSVISKILSRGEESDDIATVHESFHSYINKECYVWQCGDVTNWCDVAVSSRQGMAGALTDGSTETFWESGDEDRNKPKWVQVTAHASSDDRPNLVCLHLDNTRDTLNKTLLVSFLLSCGSGDMFHMQDVDVDNKSAGWFCYPLPRMVSGGVRVRCELRGPEAAVRVRQVRVLSAPQPARASPPAALMRALAEADALRVFRLLTSQVFGKLLECGGEVAAEPAPRDDAAADDSDLREHVVGILFAGHQLTSLQRQVMSHIVTAIGGEASRARDDFETAILCKEMGGASPAPPDIAEGGDALDSDEAREPQQRQDSYCFEMLSLLLALSGSQVGRAQLAQRPELLAELLALLHAGSERVQRQVIFLLRRMIAEIPPYKMQVAINQHIEEDQRVPLLEHLVTYVAKAIRVQVRVKGGGGAAAAVATLARAAPPRWYARAATPLRHAQLAAHLLADMAQDKLSTAWGEETRLTLANFAVRLANVSELDREVARCVCSLTMWLALGALCVLEPAHLDLVNGCTAEEVCGACSPAAERPLCANHDDGRTPAAVECRTCGPLCPECDRCLHLPRNARRHRRQICKEEESSIRIDIHEGCGRAKLFWLLLLVDRRTLKALAEFRGEPGGGGEAVGAVPLAGLCRFCGATGNTGLLAIGNVCADPQCQEHGREACTRVLPCGHSCGGVRGERTCLPCLHGCTAAAAAAAAAAGAAAVEAGAGGGAVVAPAGEDVAAPLRQDADDMCMICFTDPLQAAPAIQLKCGHVFHLHCCKLVLQNRWIGPRITFSFSQCPICKDDINHWTLEPLLTPVRALREEVRRKALMRLEYEGAGAGAGGAGAGAARRDMAQLAMDRYAYYVCHKCGKAYFGGLARCEAESSGRWSPAELVCGACSDVAGARVCPKHGADFLEYKCRYCCSVAVFFCFGTSHFCNACHDDFQRVTNIPKNQLPHCPAGPKGIQLPGTVEECPLHVSHPDTGEEFALGCGVCRHAHAF